MPAWAATASAVAGLSPVSSTVRKPSLRSSATAAAADGLTVSATANPPRTCPSHPASTTVHPACSHERHPLATAAGTVMPRWANRSSRPMITSWSSTDPRAPRPGMARNLPAWGSEPSPARAAALTAPATGCSDACSTAPA